MDSADDRFPVDLLSNTLQGSLSTLLAYVVDARRDDLMSWVSAAQSCKEFG